MKTVIIYASVHHGNTKQLIDAISKAEDVDVIDATKETNADLSEYDRIGFASGIYYSKFHKTVLDFARNNLPKGKDVFFIYTAASTKKSSSRSIRDVVSAKSAQVFGEYACPGFNTYGPFKLVGGIAKGHPTADEVTGAVDFYRSL